MTTAFLLLQFFNQPLKWKLKLQVNSRKSVRRNTVEKRIYAGNRKMIEKHQ
ncbi:hypothetical protein [Segetibacter aerophilus]|uniref:hypothetical protein n=1 Tax=Segetibacter aerophilus TaxID=670293 RepID=UPI0014788B92|nr:hypothetical protein [Segetibacter aerophilus]